MTNSAYISLNEAAKLTGRAKSTISKALKSGKISYVSKDASTGAYEIDPAEALRAFPPKQETGKGYQIETPRNPTENSVLSAEIEALRKQIETAEAERNREREQLSERIESLQQMLSDEKSERRQLTAILTDHREKPAQPAQRKKWPWQR